MNLDWTYDPEWDVWNLKDDGGRLWGWITKRNSYCDRGHFLGNVEIGGMNEQDSRPNYFMRLDRAMEEIKDFVLWRVAKIRTEQIDHNGDPIDLGQQEPKGAAEKARLEALITGDG